MIINIIRHKSNKKCSFISLCFYVNYICGSKLKMKFELLNKDVNSSARAGKITTDHGVIETPIFMPVGTVASVKEFTKRIKTRY